MAVSGGGQLFGGANVRSAFVLHSREKEGGAVAGVARESTSFYGSWPVPTRDETFATLRISAPPRKTPSQTTVPRLGLTVIYKIFIHRETATAQKHSNTSINVNKTKATTKSVIIQMTHGGEWTLKYDEPEAESHHISMSHERPCFICFVVWPTTSLKLYIVFWDGG